MQRRSLDPRGLVDHFLSLIFDHGPVLFEQTGEGFLRVAGDVRHSLHLLSQIDSLLPILLPLNGVVHSVVLAVHEEARQRGLAHAWQSNGYHEEFPD